MQINANYSVNGVPYDNKRKQNNIPQFSTECGVQENENTTESAIQATSQALYDLDHPREYVPKSIEVQQVCMKEREFYVAFLEELEKLKVKI